MSETNTPPEGEGEVTTIGIDKPETIKLQAPDDVTSISVRGMQFDIPANGVVEAPADVAAELTSHGFTPVAAPARKTTRAKVQG